MTGSNATRHSRLAKLAKLASKKGGSQDLLGLAIL